MSQGNQSNFTNETELKLAEKWKNATIANNFIFYMVSTDSTTAVLALPPHTLLRFLE